MQTSSFVRHAEMAGSPLDKVFSQSVENGLQSIRTQIDETASVWTKMRVQRRAGAMAGQTAIELFRIQNSAKERAIGAMIVAKHDLLQKELLKLNLAATAEVEASIATLFMETRARLTKIIVNDELDLLRYEVSETEKINAQVAEGKLSEHRAKAICERLLNMVDAQLKDNNAVVEQIIHTLTDRVAQALKPLTTR